MRCTKTVVIFTKTNFNAFPSGVGNLSSPPAVNPSPAAAVAAVRFEMCTALSDTLVRTDSWISRPGSETALIHYIDHGTYIRW